jgi:phosphatidylglycerophosphate synthase
VKRWAPHAISFLRIPLAFILLITHEPQLARLELAVGLFLLAALSDKLDGILARRLRVASYEGYLVDGFADRTFSVACILVATSHYHLPLFVALIAIARELLMYTCRLIDPAAWYPPTKDERAHSLLVFTVTRLWFLALLALDILHVTLGVETELISCAANYIYAIVVSISLVAFCDMLFKQIAKCFEHERP